MDCKICGDLLINGKIVGKITDYDSSTGTITYTKYTLWQRVMLQWIINLVTEIKKLWVRINHQ